MKGPLVLQTKRIVKSIIALGGLAAGSLFATSTANAHVSIYVAGMSGAAVDTTAAGNPTYIVSFAPGHGCSGPKTALNPEGVYDTTSLEVFMPKDSTGKYILPEVRAVNNGSYTAEVKTEANPDPTGTIKTALRVKSVVFSGFSLKAKNGGMTARDTQLFSIQVKLPTLAAMQALSTHVYTGATASTGVELYFPQVQYCDVTGMGVGTTTTAASATATVSPQCAATDTPTALLFDDWTTTGNTPKVVIGTKVASATNGYIDGNKTTKAVAPELNFCQGTPTVNAATLPLRGNFTANLTGTGAKKRAVLRVDASSVSAGSKFSVVDAAGKVVASGKLDKVGDAVVFLTGSKAKGFTKSALLSLYIGKTLSAVDAL
jgi:hypothetical protein